MRFSRTDLAYPIHQGSLSAAWLISGFLGLPDSFSSPYSLPTPNVLPMHSLCAPFAPMWIGTTWE